MESYGSKSEKNGQTALSREVGEALLSKGWLVATAESLTGGLIAGALTGIPGSSAWVDRGFVVYNDKAKEEMLGVPRDALDRFTAVSVEVVEAMAKGALEKSAADVAVAVSGVAGPSGGSEGIPVGSVCYACATRNGDVFSVRWQFAGGRDEVRESTVAAVLTDLKERLTKGA